MPQKLSIAKAGKVKNSTPVVASSEKTTKAGRAAKREKCERREQLDGEQPNKQNQH
jgi:ribosomal protein S30